MAKVWCFVVLLALIPPVTLYGVYRYNVGRTKETRDAFEAASLLASDAAACVPFVRISEPSRTPHGPRFDAIGKFISAEIGHAMDFVGAYERCSSRFFECSVVPG
jgi:hypothetical protein